MLKRKLHTLFTNPIGVFEKYTRWNRLVARLRGLLPPIANESYDRHWYYVSFKDKIVLDLGADYGSTSSYFLWRGAKHVVAVEANKELAEALRKNFRNDVRVTPMERFIQTSEDIDAIIAQYTPDIVKMDIEGYELSLLSCKNTEKVKEWLIECHNRQSHDKIKTLFLQKGFKVTSIEYGKILSSPNLTVLVTVK